MTFSFISTQISGIGDQYTNDFFTLHNPLSLTASRIDTKNSEIFDVFLHKTSCDSSVKVLGSSEAKDGQVYSSVKLFDRAHKFCSTDTSAPESYVEEDKHLIPVGDYRLMIKIGDEEVPATKYRTIPNGIIAKFENDVKVKLSSLNTVIQIDKNALNESDKDEYEWIQELVFSTNNYKKSSDLLAKTSPEDWPEDKKVNLPKPYILDDDIIKVATMVNNRDAKVYGAHGVNPVFAGEDNNIEIDKSKLNIESTTPTYQKYIDNLFAYNDGGKNNMKPYDDRTGFWYSGFVDETTSQLSYYLNSEGQKDQFDLRLIPGTNNNLDPIGRAGYALGLNAITSGYNHIVTVALNKKSLFRPKGGDDLKNTVFQTADNRDVARLPEFIQAGKGEQYKDIDEDKYVSEPEKSKWHSYAINKSMNELGKSLNKVTYGSIPEDKYKDFSSWYQNWWNNNTPTGNFPFGGRGYTYDAYYMTSKGWSGKNPQGPAVAEFHQTWAPPMDNNKVDPDPAYEDLWKYKVLDVQTIHEAMGADETPGPADLKISIKSSLKKDFTIHLFKADSITGRISQLSAFDDHDRYIDEITNGAIEKVELNKDSKGENGMKQYVLTKDSSGNNLSTGTNYGIMIEIDHKKFTTYGETSKNFVSLNPKNEESFVLGFEKSKINGRNVDFADIIFTFESV